MNQGKTTQIDENIPYTVYINSAKGYIVLHSQTKKKYFPNCRLVKLFFNNHTKEILIQPGNKQDPECSALSHSVIHALRKFRNFNFKVLAGHYKADWDLVTNCLVIKAAGYIGMVKKDVKPFTVRMDKRKCSINLHIHTLKTCFFNCEHVEISFDRKTERLNIKPITVKTPHSVSLEYPSGRMQYYSFVTQNGVNLDNFQTGSYLAIWDEEQKCLTIEPGNYLGESNKRGRYSTNNNG